MLKQLRIVKFFPSWNHAKSGISFHDGPVRLTLEWPDPARPEFLINGVKWTYHSSERLVPQIEKLEIELRKKSVAENIREMVLPSAYACGPPCVILVGAIGVVVATMLADPIKAINCKLNLVTSVDCTNLKKAKEQELYKNEPRFTAIKDQIGTHGQNVLFQFESEEWVCPTTNDGQERRYLGRIRTIEVKDGKKTPISEWDKVALKLKADGTLEDIMVTDNNTDPERLDVYSPAAKDHLIVHIPYDPSNEKPLGYRVPNEEFGPNKKIDTPPTVLLTPLSDNMTPKQKEQMDLYRDLAKYLNLDSYKCVLSRTTDEKDKGINAGSPADPKPDADKANGAGAAKQ
jgi:hypothetical protein